jgi:hypothetical protein
MIIAKYPIAPPQKTLKKTTIQNQTVLVSGLIKTSLKNIKQKTNPAKLLTTKRSGIKICIP